MRIITGRTAILKSAIILVAVFCFGFLAFLGTANNAAASASGPSPSHTNAPLEDNCTACHTTFPVNSGGGSVQISGVPVNYFSGQQLPITVTTSDADAVIYGFQLTALDSNGLTVGTFTLPTQNPPTMQAVDNIVGGNTRLYVEHTVDGLFTNGLFGSNSWTFTWTAPLASAGPVIFYAAGNAANSDGTPTGDHIYTTSAPSSPATAASISGKVLSPDLRGVRGAKVTLTGANFAVSTLTNSLGNYSFSGIPVGQDYVLRAFSKNYRFSQQNLTLNNNLANMDFFGQE